MVNRNTAALWLRDIAAVLRFVAALCFGVGLAMLTLGLESMVVVQAQRMPAGHVGSMVVFVHYDQYPGEKRAAMLLENPHACPEGTPNGMTDCAGLRFWTKTSNAGVVSEFENPTSVMLDGIPTPAYTNNGDDWKCCVPHDPTGQFHRSWHLWGEALGEE